MCWRLETSVSKTRCSSNEILIWQKYSAKLSSHTLCVERKSFKNCSAFPCPLLYSPCKQNGSTIWIWILSTYVVYLWEYDWANRQLFLHYSPLLHASSCKTSHLIAPCRILNRIFNGYEEMVGKNAKKKKMERRQSCHCQRSLTAECDSNFQGLCSTYSNFCWKTERKKKWPVLQLHNHFNGPFYWWVQLLNESPPSLDFLPLSKVNWLYICLYTFLNLLSFTWLSTY